MCVGGMDIPPCQAGQGGGGRIVQEPAPLPQAPATTGQRLNPDKEPCEHRREAHRRVAPSALRRLGAGHHRRPRRKGSDSDHCGTDLQEDDDGLLPPREERQEDGTARRGSPAPVQGLRPHHHDRQRHRVRRARVHRQKTPLQGLLRPPLQLLGERPH